MTNRPEYRLNVLISGVIDLNSPQEDQLHWIIQLGKLARRNILSDGNVAALLYGFVQGASFKQKKHQEIITTFERLLKQQGFGYLTANKLSAHPVPRRIPFNKHFD